MFQFVLGANWGAPATVETLLLMKAMLPRNAEWTAMGVGSKMFPMAMQSVLLGRQRPGWT